MSIHLKEPTLEKTNELLAFANTVVDEMRELIKGFWAHGDFGGSLKEDKSPVTEVDLQAEKLAREMIRTQYPGHGIIGEEFPVDGGNCDYQWVLDPIDGTQNLINRIPTFGSLVGLRYKGEPILGVIDHPILDLRTYGGKGLGVFHNGKQISFKDKFTTDASSNTLKKDLDNFSNKKPSHNDIVCINSLAVFELSSKIYKEHNLNARELFDKVVSFHPHTRIYYDCYSQTLCLLGCFAVDIQPSVKLWDYTPLWALIPEVGGKIVKFATKANSLQDTTTSIIYGVPHFVDQLVEHLGVKID